MSTSQRSESSYEPLANYGAIGDCRTAALVSSTGSIDWWCPDRFDAPSVLARLLDVHRGGHFRIASAKGGGSEQAYDPMTNVLITHWRAEGAHAKVQDFMPLTREGDLVEGRSRIVRLVTCRRGRVDLTMRFEPRPDYGRAPARVDVRGMSARSGRVALATSVPLEGGADFAGADFTLEAGGSAIFELGTLRDGAPSEAPTAAEAVSLLRDTRRYWLNWAAENRYEGPYRDLVVRSALALKLLHHVPTGALVAAPTASLPEVVGGVRNWDYRYAWIRDCAFAVGAFFQAGHLEDAGRLAHWAGNLLARDGPQGLRLMYRLDGNEDLSETTLDHFEGHRASTPVRIGNAAFDQWQLDVYGELVDCLHTCRMLGAHREEELEWDHLRGLIDYVARNWERADESIWEVRTEPAHFVISKVMAWVALDRGVRAIEELGLAGPLDAWRETRSRIHEDVLEKGFDKRLRAFTQAYGVERMDAANLLLPLLGFIDPRDERMVSTVERIRQELEENGLVYRYRGGDGLPGEEGTFSICSFWLVEVLALMGRLDDARRLMGRLVERASPLGLYAEQIDARTGEHLGNFPQAFTHIGLIHAATAIARAEGLDEAQLHKRDLAPPEQQG